MSYESCVLIGSEALQDHATTSPRDSKLLPPFVKSIPSLFSNPPSDLSTNITRILEMDTTKDPAISVILHSLLNACGPPRDDLLNVRYITAQLHINIITAVPQADDSASRTTERGVRAQVVLMIGRRVEKRDP
jgi:hypothetical protein